MHEELWAGVELKASNAEFFLDQMGRSLQRPTMNVAVQSARAIVGTQWQRAFYAHLDAFLAMGRSVPEVINCCFGEDTGNKPMRDWFDGLAAPEQKRRRMSQHNFRLTATHLVNFCSARPEILRCIERASLQWG
jgi:hypothetical protein